MKILHVLAGAKHGGAEMACIDTCLAMHEAGEEVTVVTRKNEVRVPLLQKAGIKVSTLPFGGAIDLYTPWKIARIIRKFEPDIVQTWLSRAAQKTPNWSQTKTPKPYKTVARLGGYYRIKHFKTMDYFISITPDLREYLKGEGVAPDHVRTILNFAETPADDVTPVSRQDLDTPQDATVILTLARLHEAKALDVAIDSLKDLPNVYLWLAGEGPLRKDLEQRALKNGVSERVRFLGWRTDRQALLQAADICAFISRYEPFGTVFAQSWANKTPVIVSDADGPKQFCLDDHNALVVAKDDVPAFVEAVKRLEQDKALAKTIIDNGYQLYLSDFTREKTIKDYLDYYRYMLSNDDDQS